MLEDAAHEQWASEVVYQSSRALAKVEIVSRQQKRPNADRLRKTNEELPEAAHLGAIARNCAARGQLRDYACAMHRENLMLKID